MADEVTQDTNKVDSPLPAYNDFMEVLKPLDTLMQGTRGMQAAETDYLPQEAEELTIDYNNRLARTKLTNYFKRTVDKLGGEVFSKPVVPSEDMDKTILEFTENVDNNGHDITQWSLGVFKEGVKSGITHFLIDYPQVKLKKEGGVAYFYDEDEEDKEKAWKPWTKANEKKLNYRPNWVHVAPSQLIGWRTEIKQGTVTLTQIRILEQTEEPDGDYGQRTVDRIRVFTEKTWEVHMKDKDGTYSLESSGTNNLGYVPFVSVYLGERVREMVVNPPLEGLSDLNILHWQSTSDQRNILHYARLVIYFGKMMDVKDGKMVIGPNRFVLSDDPDSDLRVVEHSGEAIGAGRQDIKDIESSMTMFGLTMMMPKTGAQTATERAIDSSENDSSLKSWALSMEDALNEAIRITADYLQIDPDTAGTVDVNTDFQSFMATVEAGVLILAKEKNIIPAKIVIDEFIRRGILKEGTDPLEIDIMMEEELQKSMDFQQQTMTPSPFGGPKEKAAAPKVVPPKVPPKEED
jgi:hypothetical protein